MLLGNHLIAATKEKILKGEFVNIVSLLFREAEMKDKDNLEEEKLKDRKVHRPIDCQTTLFMLFFSKKSGSLIIAASV